MNTGEYELIFGLDQRARGKENTAENEQEVVAALKKAAAETCGGFTVYYGEGGWLYEGRVREERVAVFKVRTNRESAEKIARLGQEILNRIAIYVKPPNGEPYLLYKDGLEPTPPV